MLPFVLLTVVAVAALLYSEANGHRVGVWIAKPLASTGFVCAALAAGALDTPYGKLVLLALILSWLGDVLLIEAKTFLPGLVSFLLGHLAFAVAFAVRGIVPLVAVGTGALLLVPMGIALRWLAPHVPPKMKLPVQAYITVISTMVMCAAGAAWAAGMPAILIGAVAFYLSDLAVARQRFVAKSFTNKLWGLPLYYGAQLILAWTVAS
jgi:uncharacterized membrane protein YhhN